MMKAKWYRNPPEKDQDKPAGRGEIIHFGLLERAGEGIAVIVDSEGNLIEKPFSLVRVVVEPGPEVNTPPVAIKHEPAPQAKPSHKPVPTKQK